MTERPGGGRDGRPGGAMNDHFRLTGTSPRDTRQDNWTVSPAVTGSEGKEVN